MLKPPEFNSKLELFRQEISEFIRNNLPADIRNMVASEQMDLPREAQQRWHKILNSRGGWGCPSWPIEHGGPGWSDEQQYIFERELALNDAPRLMIYGVGMLGPALFKYGSEWQKQHFLPEILNGDTFWCQGFSEPNAGSDLASLKASMTRDKDEFVINGSKIWTSEAHIADWIFGIFRSSTGTKKQQGISFVLIDMATPGISINPLLLFEGTHEVNQVFFDQVRVPARNCVGELGQGWEVAKYLLSLERFGTAEVSRTLASFQRLSKLAHAENHDGTRLIDQLEFKERFYAIERALHALEITERRFLLGDDVDNIGAGASMLKIRGTEIQSDVLRLTAEAYAHYATIDIARNEVESISTPNQVCDAGRNYFNYRKTPIYSGSNEIQRNIIAKAQLRL